MVLLIVDLQGDDVHLDASDATLESAALMPGAPAAPRSGPTLLEPHPLREPGSASHSQGSGTTAPCPMSSFAATPQPPPAVDGSHP